MRRNTGENTEQPGSQHGQGNPQGRPPSQQGRRPPQQPPLQGGQPRQGMPQPPQGQQPQQIPQQHGAPLQQSHRGAGGGPRNTPEQIPQHPQGQQQAPMGQQQAPMGQQQGPIGQQQPPGQGPPQGQHTPGMQGSGGQQGLSQSITSQQGAIGRAPGMGAQGMRQPGMGPHLQSVDLTDIVQTDIVTAEPDTSVSTLASMMAEEDVGAVIIAEDDEPMGIITDRTIALQLREGENVSEQPARELMAEQLVTGTTMMTVFDVLDRMSEETIRRLPIVDEDNSLEGIVTLDDILVLLGTEMEKASAIIKTQSPRL